jgi:hypothetical protein
MSPSARGRILAAFYLFVVISGVVAQSFIADGLVVANDAGKTAANILANTSLYRLAFTIFMVEMAAQVVTTAMFYDLLKPVNRSVARLSLIMGLIASGIKTFARLFYYAPLILLSGASYLAAIGATQLAALSLVSVKINNQGSGDRPRVLRVRDRARGMAHLSIRISATLPRCDLDGRRTGVVDLPLAAAGLEDIRIRRAVRDRRRDPHHRLAPYPRRRRCRVERTRGPRGSIRLAMKLK